MREHLSMKLGGAIIFAALIFRMLFPGVRQTLKREAAEVFENNSNYKAIIQALGRSNDKGELYEAMSRIMSYTGNGGGGGRH